MHRAQTYWMENWQPLHVDQNCQRMRAAVIQWSAKFSPSEPKYKWSVLFKEKFVMDKPLKLV